MVDTEWPPSEPQRREGPPKPPGLRPAVALTLRQWVGIPILTLIPILALFGLFGEHLRTEQTTVGGLGVTITYPDRVHYRQTLTAQLTVHNRGAVPLDTVWVQYDTAYLNAFLVSGATPAFTIPYRIPLTAVQPGEHRMTLITLNGDQRGRVRGAVHVTDGTDTVRLPLSTFVFP